jgi:ADP-ribose pyrophosphatase
MKDIADTELSWPVVESVDVYSGYIIGVRHDTVRGPDGDTFERDVVTHRGAVAILAVDDDERVLVVRQYRHPAQQQLVELPAGLLDQEGEEPLAAAQRELAEEGQAKAARWSPLLELMTSPGISDEVITVYLAEGISDAPLPAGFTAAHEESTMTREWVALADLVAAALSGRIKNAATVAGILALQVRRKGGHRSQV